MSLLSRVARGAKRLLRNKIVQTVASIGTGGISDAVLSSAKSIGAATRGNRLMRKQTKAVAHAATKLASVRPPGLYTTSTGPATLENPGVSWEPKEGPSRRRKRSGTKSRTGSPASSGAGRRKKKSAVSSTTRPNSGSSRTRQSKSAGSRKRRGGKLRSGMLDLKAMSAAYKAAGSPGTWRQWIADKANHIRVK